MSTNVVVVGTGMAGYTFAREFKKLAPEAQLTLITSDNGDNYAKPTLSNAFAAGKGAEQIAMADAEKMRQTLGASILNHSTVTSIDTEAKSLSVTDASGNTTQVSYDSLVLAVGASPIRLNLQGSGADDVISVNTLDDYSGFRAKLEACPNKSVAIIGGGLIGCEFANDLTQAGFKVHVIDLARQVLGGLLNEEAAKPLQSALESEGVSFHLGKTTAEVAQADQGYKVSFSDQSSIEVDLVLSAVGLRPNLELAHMAGAQTQRGIVVDSMLQTTAADVYAIGDCAEVEGHVLPYVMPLMSEARALAKTLSGTPTKVSYGVMPIGVKTPAMPLVILPPKDSEATAELETTEDGLVMKFVDQSGNLSGFILLGKEAGKQRMALSKEAPTLLN